MESQDNQNQEIENQDKPQNVYYRKNKDKVLSKLRVKATCECGAVVNHSGLLKHMATTKKHAERMKKINESKDEPNKEITN